ncbi:MAG: amidohydrolase family protein, partial [Saprospiraceae bacterium]|nr:amidohydrolase family protein [Saprospiraceae bacterium]
MFSRFLLFAILVWSSCSAPKLADSADLILFNGNIFTADSALSNATAIAIRGDKILAVGNDADIKKLATEKTQLLDLNGQFVMPGFIEGHGHFNGLGKSLQNLNLMPTTSWSEIVGLVAEKAKTAPAGQWIEGRGWHQEKWSSTPVGAV